jgi:uncharacterized protein (DUF427 family)
MPAHWQQPGLGQESVWDYPRCPRVEQSTRHIEVVFNGVIIADTRLAKRVLEVGLPPVYYIPPADTHSDYFFPSSHRIWCQWRGEACHYLLRVNERESQNAAWYYPEPKPDFEAIRHYVAFYPSRVDACYVDGERVEPYDSCTHGGWITHEIAGPFEGSQDTSGW